MSLLYDVVCSPQFNSMVGQPLTKELFAANASGDDVTVTWISSCVSGDTASDLFESHLSCQNNVLNLSDKSMAQSSNCSKLELVQDGRIDNWTLGVPSTAPQTMKRTCSLPSSLLRYVSQCRTSCREPSF